MPEPIPHVSIDTDLIGYTDWWLDASARAGRPIAGWVTLIKRLRAALAVQPLFEGTIRDLLAGDELGRQWPLDHRVVVYPAVAGSATPTRRTAHGDPGPPPIVGPTR
jgi:hypothetical protein